MANNSLIIVPAYNSCNTIRSVISRLPIDKTIIIDDGSSDETSKIVNQLGYQLIRHPVNLGLSAAIKTGEQYAFLHGYSHVLLMDSDGQHPPEKYPEFISMLEKHEFVLGDRFSRLKGIPQQKIASNLFASLLIKDATGIFLRDVSCGYRGYKLDKSLIEKRAEGFSGIYIQIIQNIINGVKPYRVFIPALYDYSKPLVTKCSEIDGLCKAIFCYSKKKSIIDYVYNTKQ